MLEALAEEFARDFAKLPLGERLSLLRREVPGRIVFTSSLGLEDQVLTHVIAEQKLDIEITTLDTGRLFPETYQLWEETEAHYGLRIKAFTPSHEALQHFVDTEGVNAFRHSIDVRKTCCGIRKVEPLGRALAGANAWVTGLRADQSAGRGGASFAEVDRGHQLLKVNPLLDWTRDQAAAFAEANHVPVNALHARGFLSIGCAPCTRAIAPGEPERAGRWWWEDEANKECGLHVGPDGRLVRTKRPESVA